MRSMYRMVIAGATALALVVGASPAHAATDPTTLQQKLDAIHAAGMPGAFAKVRDDGTTWRGATGVADIDTRRPMRPHLQHRVGSITKTLVATALLQLVGEGRLTLDEPVGRHVGDLLPPDLAASVTLRMLLNHTSGISDIDHVMVTTYEELEAVHRTTYTPKQLIDIALAEPRTNAPGAAHNYSNTGYIIAGVILERVTGRPAELEIARRITIPLGLWQTYLPGSFPFIVGPHSEGYVPYPDGSLRDFSVANLSWLWTAGALISTADDLDTFYRALLSGKLLRPAQLTQMKTAFGDSGYGLGLYRVDLPCGVSVWGHDGAVFGYTTIAWQAEDGATRIVHAQNLYPLADPASANATADFILTALCGPADTARARPTPTLPLRDSLPLPRS